MVQIIIVYSIDLSAVFKCILWLYHRPVSWVVLVPIIWTFSKSVRKHNEDRRNVQVHMLLISIVR